MMLKFPFRLYYVLVYSGIGEDNEIEYNNDDDDAVIREKAGNWIKFSVQSN